MLRGVQIEKTSHFIARKDNYVSRLRVLRGTKNRFGQAATAGKISPFWSAVLLKSGRRVAPSFGTEWGGWVWVALMKNIMMLINSDPKKFGSVPNS